jgi:hypothetical protein
MEDAMLEMGCFGLRVDAVTSDERREDNDQTMSRYYNGKREKPRLAMTLWRSLLLGVI